jgi:hypothetical protein
MIRTLSFDGQELQKFLNIKYVVSVWMESPCGINDSWSVRVKDVVGEHHILYVADIKNLIIPDGEHKANVKDKAEREHCKDAMRRLVDMIKEMDKNGDN